jgi:thiamine biosynthesis lipoprotein ApbE
MKKSVQQVLASMTAASLGMLPAFAATHTDSAKAGQAPAANREAAGTWGFQHENVLGTSLDMSVSAGSRAQARKAEAAALAEFDRQSNILSAWDVKSEFSRWQKTHGVAMKVSPELMDVLARFDAWQGETGGVLNASSEAAAKVWRGAASRGSQPSTAELTNAVHAMQQKHWSLDAANGTATRLSDAPLVLASFTKSLITQKAADAALHAGATGVMLNVGGDIVTRGALTQRVDIADPNAHAENDGAIDTVVLRDRAIATSGSYRRGFVVAGQQLSHLIDPRTAQPAAAVLSSSVIAQDAATAGALATALSILSPRESQALMQRHPDAQYLIVTSEGERISSNGWAAYAEPKIERAAYAVRANAAAPVASANWNQSMELVLKVDLLRIDNPRYRRPYVAVWIEDKDKYPVRTVALWFKNPRWLNELKGWYRDDQVRNLTEGTDISGTVSSATRAPGAYTLKWDGKDNAGKLVKAGKYTVVVEAAREHGGHSLLKQEIDFNGTAAKLTLPASEELGAVELDYRKH